MAAPPTAGVPTPRAGEPGVAGSGSWSAAPAGIQVSSEIRSGSGGGERDGELLQAGTGFMSGKVERGAAKRRRQTREEDFIYDLKTGCLMERRRKGDLGMQQEG